MRNVVLAVSHPSKETVYGMVMDVWRDERETDGRLEKLILQAFHHDRKPYLKTLCAQGNLPEILGYQMAAKMAVELESQQMMLRICKDIAGYWKPPQRKILQKVGGLILGEDILDFDALVEAARLNHTSLPGLCLTVLASVRGRAELSIRDQVKVVNSFRDRPQTPLLTLLALDAAVRFDDDPKVGKRMSALVASITEHPQDIVFAMDDGDAMNALEGMQDHVLKWIIQGVAMHGFHFRDIFMKISSGTRMKLLQRPQVGDYIVEMETASEVIQS